jgi:hypothetical protein
MRYSSVDPLIPASGVRNSWLASATNRRARASDSARAAAASSIRSSMPLNVTARLPTSVVGAATSGTRRPESPAAMAAEVASISLSGRSPARSAKNPSAVRTASSTEPIR